MTRSFFSIARVALFLPVLLMAGAGCISVRTGGSAAAGTDGSFFRSLDQGATWERKVARPTAEGVASISGVNMTHIAQSPSFPAMIYGGTNANGVFLSFDRAETWQQVSGVSGAVTALALHPADKCTSYIGNGTRLLRSTDCSITYSAVFVDPRAKAVVSAVAIPHDTPRTVYLGTKTGDLVRSTDEGATWSPVHLFDDAIVKLVVSVQDSRTVWVLTDDGVFRSTDAGATFTDLTRSLDEYDSARIGFDLLQNPTAPNTLILTSRYGVLRSTDAGTSWSPVGTVTPPESAGLTISASAISQSGTDLYYAAGNTLYASHDGGNSWSTHRLPASRIAKALLVDTEDEQVMYMGLVKTK